MRINSRNNLTQISDGTSNTISVGETPSDASASKRGSHCGHKNNLRQPGDSFERGGRNNLTQISDGTSNTIVVGESPSDGSASKRGSRYGHNNNLRQQPNDGSVRTIGEGNNLRQSGITDGTSNTILVPETPIRVKTGKECK